MRIHGVIAARNEWPLLALSISHALTYNVDKVFVLDHKSTDNTQNGLAYLQKLWPDQIEVFRYEADNFDQEAVVNALLEISNEQDPDWNIILDADEFLVSPSKDDIRLRLSSIDAESKWTALAINLENFIVPTGFNDRDIDSYQYVHFYIKSENHVKDREEFYASVWRGERYLHEFRIPTKILVKNTRRDFVDAGQHQLKYGNGKFWELWDTGVAASSTDNWMICHLPYTGVERLRARRDMHSYSHNELAATIFGKRISSDKELIQVWNSLQLNYVLAQDDERAVYSPRLSQTLAPVIDMLRPHWINLLLSPQVRTEYSISSREIERMTRVMRKYINACDILWDNQRREGQ